MTEKQIKLVIGSLLHDIGKIIYRSGDGRNHSRSGYDYLKEQIGLNDVDVLNCVRFHHGNNLKSARLETNDNAFITYFADNVAAAADRRDSADGEDGFDKKIPLASVFNILNGNRGNMHFERQILEAGKGINYPTDQAAVMDEEFYESVIRNITDNLKGISFTEAYLNSLLSVLEANCTYIPSSTSKRQLTDISLYDHVKITAAVASCVEQYLRYHQIDDYKEPLFVNAKKTYDEKMFILYSMDISGIQKFIYTIASKGALKGLRARSFYLEIVMEHMIDELLTSLSLCRANLIYCGGGHCYMLLPNTKEAIDIVEKQEKIVNAWFMDTFETALYVAGGYAVCSANDLKNEPDGSYSNLYLTISKMISKKKAHRYSAEEIIRLNHRKHSGERECEVCHKMSKVDEYNRCPVCGALHQMSDSILKKQFFTVMTSPSENALPLPGHMFLSADSKEQLLKKMEDRTYVRAYTKNEMYTGKYVTTKLWVGDYTTGDSFDAFAQKAEGIQRIGVLRADVDNLGRTFVSGFQRPDGDSRYVTLSRTATLSRQLSLFFKCYINTVLKHGGEDALGKSGAREAAIVYSGGDDIFLVGAWNDVTAAFIDLKKALDRFTQGTLTISGGIGLYKSGYPINIMAKQVADLEDASKAVKDKNAITLFDKKGTYPWDTFLSHVVGEKFITIRDFFEMTAGYGKAFLYHILELLRGENQRFNRARYVYLLSRMEPDDKNSKTIQMAYRQFSRKMYQWAENEEERRQTVTAIYLYVYLTRDKEEEMYDEIG